MKKSFFSIAAIPLVFLLLFLVLKINTNSLSSIKDEATSNKRSHAEKVLTAEWDTLPKNSSVQTGQSKISHEEGVTKQEALKNPSNPKFQYLDIKIKPEADIDRLFSEFKLKVLNEMSLELEFIPTSKSHEYRVRLDREVTEDDAEKLGSLFVEEERFLYFFPDIPLISETEPNDPAYTGGFQTHLKIEGASRYDLNINVFDAWDLLDASHAPVNVAILYTMVLVWLVTAIQTWKATWKEVTSEIIM